MDHSSRREFWILALLFTAVSTSFAAEPSPKPQKGPAAEHSDPKATYRAYIEAVRKNDLATAKQCWVIDDDNKSGALDTIVGMFISMRRINQVVEKKFGAEGLQAVLLGWRREDVSDAAIELTRRRLDDAEVTFTGDTAKLDIKWKMEDGPAFGFRESIHFRKVGGSWKIDANKMTGDTRGKDFFAKGTWGPLFRDQVAIMNEAVEGIEKERIKSTKELGAFVHDKVNAMKEKYEKESREEAETDK